MTKKERAVHAAKWREIARGFERRSFPVLCGYGRGTIWGLCGAADRLEMDRRPVLLFGNGCGFYWERDRQGHNCRVIAAGLIAAMYETGEFDNE
jgi:hypothetical protein